MAAPVDVEFFMGDGARRTYSLVLGAQLRRTILADSLPGLESTATSAVVTSSNALPLAVERTMTWDGSGYGSHTEAAVPGPGLTWYFAEGSEEAFFETYLLLANPQGVPNRATVQFFVEGRRPVKKQYDLPPTSRI